MKKVLGLTRKAFKEVRFVYGIFTDKNGGNPQRDSVVIGSAVLMVSSASGLLFKLLGL